MFAASRGISSRIVGAGKRSKDGPNGGHRKRKRRKMTLKQRMYLPFMWSTCVGTFLGFIVLCGGTAMCVVGYFAEYFATTETVSNTSNGTDIVITKDSSMQFHIKNLTFVGPIFMGIGAFIIVVACVVVFETRDKVLDLMEEQQRTAAKKKPDFYDLIVAQMKKKEEDILRGGQDNLAFEGVEDDLESEKVKHTCTPIMGFKRGISPSLRSTSGAIGMALRNIGSNIFTIDTARDNTLTPVSCYPFESEITGGHLGSVIIKARLHVLAAYGRHTNKYPSVSCIHDLMKAKDGVESCRRHSWLDNVQKPSSRSKYEIAPLDIPLSSTIDSQLVNINTSNSKHQSQAAIDPNEEVSKHASSFQGKYDQRKGVMGFSSEEECSDTMSTRDTCLSVVPKKRRPTIPDDALCSCIDSNDIGTSNGRTVVVMVHQAPKSISQSDLSEARSSFENPSEMFKPKLETKSSSETRSSFESVSIETFEAFNPETNANDDLHLNDKENQQEHSKGHESGDIQKCETKDNKCEKLSEERDSVHVIDEILKSFDSQSKPTKVDQNIKNTDDGNSSDSSSNA